MPPVSGESCVDSQVMKDVMPCCDVMKQVVSEALRDTLPKEVALLREDLLAAVREGMKSYGEGKSNADMGSPRTQHEVWSPTNNLNNFASSVRMPMKQARIADALKEMRRDEEHGPWANAREGKKQQLQRSRTVNSLVEAAQEPGMSVESVESVDIFVKPELDQRLRASAKADDEKADVGAVEETALANLPGVANVWEKPAKPLLEIPGADSGKNLHSDKSNTEVDRHPSQSSISRNESRASGNERAPSKRSRLNDRKPTMVDKVLGLQPNSSQIDFNEEERLEWSHIHLVAERVIRNVRFELLVSFMIIASAAHIGIQTDFMATRVIDEVPVGFRAIELVFLLFFSVELSLRLFVHRGRFFYMWGWGWNVFDFFLVFMQLAEEFVLLIVRDTESLEGLSSSFLLRIVRILRTIRTIRVLHVTRFAEELRLLVSCVLSSVKAFCWSLALILLIIYIVAIFLTQLVLTWRVDNREVVDFDAGILGNWYGNVPRTILSLFQGLTGGIDWNDLVEPMMEEIHPWLGLFFFIYTSFAILAVMNVVTATFVENAIERAGQVKESVKMTQASRLFKALDVDSSGVITLDEIIEHISTPEVSDFFKSIDVDASEAQCLFELLDSNGSGEIDFEEFLSGCMRLQGPARTIDLVLFIHDLKRGMGAAPPRQRPAGPDWTTPGDDPVQVSSCGS